MKTTTSKDIKTKLAALKEEYINTARAEFKKGTDELFDNNPTLKSFGFTAYVPHFNDGDECLYSANIDYPDINGINNEDFSYGDTKDEALQALSEIVVNFLSQFDDDIYKEIIGNHVKATITKKGIETEDYEHD